MQRIFLILGGPMDGKAYRPHPAIRGTQVNLNRTPEEFNGDLIYEVVRVPKPREPLMIPMWVLVHRTVPRDEVLWRTFMGVMRSFCLEVLG